MNLDNDIFVSYAHIDDQPLVEGQKGWISSFHRALEVRLSQFVSREPRLWRDPQLQGNDIHADRLVQCLPGALAWIGWETGSGDLSYRIVGSS